MVNKNGVLKKLIKSVIVSSIMLGLSVPAYGFCDGVLTKGKSNNKYNYYNYFDLISAYENNFLGIKSKLFNDYISKEICAIHDSENGFIDYKAIERKAEDAYIMDEYFDLSEFIKNSSDKFNSDNEILLVREDENGNLIKKKYLNNKLKNVTEENSKSYGNKFGNEFCNLNDYGCNVAKSGDYIYYSTDYSLVRMKEDGTQKQQLNKKQYGYANIYNLNVMNGKIYFLYEDYVMEFDPKEYKFHKLGSGKKLSVDNKNLYYVGRDKKYENTESLYKINLKTLEKKMIIQNLSDYIMTDNYIVYTKGLVDINNPNDPTPIFVTDREGNNEEEVYGIHPTDMNPYNENMYYREGTGVYCLDIKTKQKTRIGEGTILDKAKSIHVYKGRIYFEAPDIEYKTGKVINANEHVIYSCDLSGGNVKKIINCGKNDHLNFYILGEYIYFDDNKRIDIYGTYKEVLWRKKERNTIYDLDTVEGLLETIKNYQFNYYPGEYIKKIVKLDPQYGKMYMKIGEYEKAKKLGCTEGYIMSIEVNMEKDKMLALKECDETIEFIKHGKKEKGFYSISEKYNEKNGTEIEDKENLEKVYKLKVEILKSLGKVDEAIKVCSEGIECCITKGLLYEQRADLYYEKGKINEAISDYEKSMELRKSMDIFVNGKFSDEYENFTDLTIKLIKAYLVQNQQDKAKKLIKDLYELEYYNEEVCKLYKEIIKTDD